MKSVEEWSEPVSQCSAESSKTTQATSQVKPNQAKPVASKATQPSSQQMTIITIMATINLPNSFRKLLRSSDLHCFNFIDSNNDNGDCIQKEKKKKKAKDCFTETHTHTLHWWSIYLDRFEFALPLLLLLVRNEEGDGSIPLAWRPINCASSLSLSFSQLHHSLLFFILPACISRQTLVVDEGAAERWCCMSSQELLAPPPPPED